MRFKSNSLFREQGRHRNLGAHRAVFINILAVHISACLDVSDGAIHLSTQNIGLGALHLLPGELAHFSKPPARWNARIAKPLLAISHMLLASSILVWLDAPAGGKYEKTSATMFFHRRIVLLKFPLLRKFSSMEPRAHSANCCKERVKSYMTKG